MIKNIIFDLGGVMLQFRFLPFLREHGFAASNKKYIDGLLFDWEPWNLCDLGVLNDNDKVVSDYCDEHPEMGEELSRTLKEKWRETITVRKNMPEYLIGLKKRGLNVYVISNLSRQMYERHIQNEFFRYVDGAVFSFQEHLLKPDHRIFETFLNRYQLKAEECLFIDDSKPNVLAAREIGMKAARFRCRRETEDRVNALIEKSRDE